MQELSDLHRRYVDAVNRLKAAWTLQEFLAGQQKLFGGEEVAEPAAADLQPLYASVKEISDGLGSADVARTRRLVERLERDLQQVSATLLREDSRVPPSHHRQFFQRVRGYDERILTLLLRFYLQAPDEPRWGADRLDKIDFLVTRLAERLAAGSVRPDLGRLREALQGLLGLPRPGPQVEALRRAVEEAGEKARRAGSAEQLKQAIGSYREIKHGLGRLYFQPTVLEAIIETNRLLKAAVQRLVQREERSIFADSERIFALEGRVALDRDLDGEVIRIRRELEAFEGKLRQDDVRLGEVAAIRSRLRSVLPRIEGADAGASRPAPLAPPSGGEAAENAEEEALLGADYAELVQALEVSDDGRDPRQVVAGLELFLFRLEPREVVAWRRLAEEGGAEREHERFLLRSAALRRRIRRQVEAIQGLMTEAGDPGEVEAYAEARRLTALGDAYLGRFGGAIDHAVSEGRLAEAQALQALRMRLVRDHSGLWLLARPPLPSDDRGIAE